MTVDLPTASFRRRWQFPARMVITDCQRLHYNRNKKYLQRQRIAIVIVVHWPPLNSQQFYIISNFSLHSEPATLKRIKFTQYTHSFYFIVAVITVIAVVTVFVFSLILYSQVFIFCFSFTLYFVISV